MQNPRNRFLRARALTAAMAALLPASFCATAPRPHEDPPDDDDRNASLQQLITRAGNADAAANELWRDNYKLREGRRKDKADFEELKKKLPPEGSVVLTKEQAADWDAYQKLGKPAEVEKGLTEGKTAHETMTQRARADAFRNAATDLKWNPDVLEQLAGMGNLELVSQTVKDAQGKDVTAHYVKDAKGNQVDLATHAQQNWQAFMPSLQAQGAGGGQGAGAGQGQGQGGQGQGAGGGQQGQGQGGQQWMGTGGAGSGGQGSGQGEGAAVTSTIDNLMKNRNSGTPNALEKQLGINQPAQNTQGGSGGGQGSGQQ